MSNVRGGKKSNRSRQRKEQNAPIRLLKKPSSTSTSSTVVTSVSEQNVDSQIQPETKKNLSNNTSLKSKKPVEVKKRVITHDSATAVFHSTSEEIDDTLINVRKEVFFI